MDLIDFWRYFGALLIVLGLAGFAAFGVKRFGVPGLAKAANARRLKIVETVMLSARQRICLVRRDGVEHLIVLGPEGATVIECGIPAPPDEPVAAVPPAIPAWLKKLGPHK